jgi:hypothetical protein
MLGILYVTRAVGRVAGGEAWAVVVTRDRAGEEAALGRRRGEGGGV